MKTDELHLLITDRENFTKHPDYEVVVKIHVSGVEVGYVIDDLRFDDTTKQLVLLTPVT